MNGNNHWILRQSDQVNAIDPWTGKHGVIFAATRDCLASHPTNKDGPNTDSYIGAHYCSTLMVDA